jgi:hypothetical protein
MAAAASTWYCCLVLSKSGDSKRVRTGENGASSIYANHIWLTSDPPRMIEYLNRGVSPPEQLAYELTAELSSSLPEPHSPPPAEVPCSRMERFEPPVLAMPPPPLYLTRLDASMLALDQLHAIHHARLYERQQVSDFSQLKPLLLPSHRPASLPLLHGKRPLFHSTLAGSAPRPTLLYQLGMVAGPLATRKASAVFGTLWNSHGRGQLQRGAVGAELARWMSVHMYADLALIITSSVGEPLRHHALLQSNRGDVWLVDLKRQHAMQQLLVVGAVK